MRFAVSIISPPGYAHQRAFAEVAESVHLALLALGHDSVLSTRLDNRRRRHIVFGPHLLMRAPQDLPPDSILYNLEQLGAGGPWDTPAYRALLRAHTVWDYAPSNIAVLARDGILARHLPIGWMPQMRRIPEAPLRDVDVLFYGSVYERREPVLRALQARGVRLRMLFNVYGAERDAWIARSRIVLNFHGYEACLFEAVRVSWLLGNGACVLSERGSDPALEADYREAVEFVEHARLVDACVDLLADAARQQQLREAGPRLMQRLDLRPTLQRCLQDLA
ncbi:hypothetical protein SAMN04488509_101627 [Aquimonas voraii]|uniref:Spore protein YkvP/CgeB glycosyl transferase-like domain-containing protein n=1 Tax=Aquimonas voraii TaxID=265719 RepID=A0A1G6SRP1_9GAMM|nr:hypothetical protein SAMN04488509_101627 [Aquimonas voraii]